MQGTPAMQDHGMRLAGRLRYGPEGSTLGPPGREPWIRVLPGGPHDGSARPALPAGNRAGIVGSTAINGNGS